MDNSLSMSILLPDGVPEFVDPGVPTAITVQINERGDSYIPGTGTLHYRYDGAAYVTAPLATLGGDLYEATLPAAGCNDVPEYYFTAEGESSGVVYNPSDAPAVVYSSLVGGLGTVWVEDFETDPGWSTEAQWAFGQPTGGGGSHGGPDPESGHTGNYVYGYNLNGDYESRMPERHLTSSAIDCSDLLNVHLSFWRWLGVEGKGFDFAYVRVSKDLVNWTTVWEDIEQVADTSWVEMDLDISAVADGQPTVYLRWTMGETDGAWEFCGWNIDDIRLLSHQCTLCGDANGDGEADVADVIHLINYLFIGGPEPECQPITVCADVDKNGEVDAGDLIYFISYLFSGASPPCG